MTEEIKLFDKVYSYDFDFYGDYGCYVYGTVVGFCEIEGCPRYSILVEEKVRDDKVREGRKNEMVFPPVNGTPTTMGRTCNGVTTTKR